MSAEAPSLIAVDIMRDLESVCESVAAGRAVDPAVIRRVQERSESVRNELRKARGELNVAVDLIRETREE
jgi:hypothetical protein